MTRVFILSLVQTTIFLNIFVSIHGPPINKETQPSKKEWINDLHYKTYLSEIANELETDPDFKKHIEENSAHNNVSDIALGLEKVHHSVRTKLDEIKRREIERLNQLEHTIQLMRSKNTETASPEMVQELNRDHLDFDNHQTFSIKDLQMLIQKMHQDLELVDQKQEGEYKKYEMEKEHERLKKLNHTRDEAERRRLEEEERQAKAEHKKHERVHHPGSKEQLKEVWTDEDKLSEADYNVKTMFKLHDLNNDNFWDEAELEALMEHELSKVYKPNDSKVDLNEKYHEMMKMRREFSELADTNKDSRISLDELLQWHNSPRSEEDPEWETTEEKDERPFSDEEFQEFERDHPNEDEEEDEDHQENTQPKTTLPTQAQPASQKPSEIPPANQKPIENPPANQKPIENPPTNQKPIENPPANHKP